MWFSPGSHNLGRPIQLERPQDDRPLQLILHSHGLFPFLSICAVHHYFLYDLRRHLDFKHYFVFVSCMLFIFHICWTLHISPFYLSVRCICFVCDMTRTKAADYLLYLSYKHTHCAEQRSLHSRDSLEGAACLPPAGFYSFSS